MAQHTVAYTLIAIALVTGSLIYMNSSNVSDIFNSITSQNNLQCIARTTIIARGQDWVTKNVPYNHDGTHDGYRTDCSGFVSMSWQLAKPGLTTFTLHTVSHSVDKTVVQPGDAMICEEHHVVLYAGWADSTKTHYIGMQEVDPARGTIKRTIPYPYFSNTTCFHPIRYNNVC